ncbi:MAG: alanine racemase [Rhodovarius sp.]|nr:alanine racemase [Rhodovarius sp.]
MRIEELQTPCLVLDLGVLRRNLTRMQAALARHPGLRFRPHLKTAKCLEVAALAAPQGGPITVSTLAEAEFFAAGGWRDQIYAVGITPQKLDRVAALNAAGADVKVITDDADAARAIAAHPGPLRALIEIDVGEHRGGVAPEEAPALARLLGPRLAGVIAHAGHSYAGRSVEEMRRIAEEERRGICRAAEAVRQSGLAVEIVSVGSSPTALHADQLAGVTELRAGVYMFGDLFQAQIGTHGFADIAVTVLASVIGRRPDRGTLLVDAGAIALSKDRSTEATPRDFGFGEVRDLDGRPYPDQPVIRRVYQEHGEVWPAPAGLRVGDRVRIAPNHSCLTVAQHDRYHVVDGSRAVIATWRRIGGW